MTADAQHNISFDEFELDLHRRKLLREGEPVTLYDKAFALLAFLVERNGQVVTKDEILEAVWPGQFVEEANLSVQISALRKALGERRDAPRFLVTIPGKGYKFVADLTNRNGEGSTNGHETIQADHLREETPANVGKVRGAAVRKSKSMIALALVGAFVVTAAAAAVYWYTRGAAPPGYDNIRITRLTNSGNVQIAAISDDGNFIAYVTTEPDGNSLWLRQVGSATDVRILSPVRAEFWGLTFSPDGTHVYYNLFAGDKADIEVFKLPVLGGVIEKIPNVIASAVTFAPDAKRMAYVTPDSAANMNYLMVANVDGTSKRVIAGKPHPNTFVFAGRSASWSPDGKVIACTVNFLGEDSNYTSIVAFDPEIGTEMPLGTSRWYGVFRVEWLRDGSGLLITAAEKPSDSAQVWLVSYPGGEVRQVTRDLNSYSSLGAAANGSFVAIQTNTVNNISVGEVNDRSSEFSKIAEETGELHPLLWTLDGRIVFRSSQGGTANLWTMDALGANRRQLTTNAQADGRGMCLSPDGEHIVFTSIRSGRSNLWRVDADGSNEAQLTNGDSDAYPQCLPDNRTIVFQRGIYSKPILWKATLADGTAEQLTDFRAKWPEVTDDGSRVAFFHMVDDVWNIGVMPADGSSVYSNAQMPSNLKENTLHWAPDNKSLYYIGLTGNAGNIWVMTMPEGSTRPYTKFTSQTLSDFAFSPDGKRVAVTRSLSLSDVILVENSDR